MTEPLRRGGTYRVFSEHGERVGLWWGCRPDGTPGEGGLPGAGGWAGEQHGRPVARGRAGGARVGVWLWRRGRGGQAGAGVVVVGWFAVGAGARGVAAECPPPWQAILVRGRNRSPLLDALQAGGASSV